MITYGTGTYAGVMIVVTGDIADIPAAVQSGMTAQGYTTTRATNLDNLDAAVSTRLAAASYTAPANAEIAAIKAKTDTLPVDPASSTNIANAEAVLKKKIIQAALI